MTFELLKVCRQANPTWIELWVMYARSTVTDRHARWVIINQNRIIIFFYFFISFCLLFFSFHFLHISLFRFVLVDFVWFRFYFVSHFISTHIWRESNTDAVSGYYSYFINFRFSKMWKFVTGAKEPPAK